MLRKLFGMAPADESATVDVAEAQRKLAAREAIMIDVREPAEWRASHVKGAKHIPLGDLATRLGEIPRDREVLLFCRSVNRSGSTLPAGRCIPGNCSGGNSSSVGAPNAASSRSNGTSGARM